MNAQTIAKLDFHFKNIFDGIEAETYIPYSQVIGVRAQKPCYLWAIRGWLAECSKMVEAATGHLLPRNPHTLDYCYVQSWVQGLSLSQFIHCKCLNNIKDVSIFYQFRLAKDEISRQFHTQKSHFDTKDPVTVVGSGQPHFQATGITSKGHCSANIHKDQTYRLNMKRQHNVDM